MTPASSVGDRLWALRDDATRAITCTGLTRDLAVLVRRRLQASSHGSVSIVRTPVVPAPAFGGVIPVESAAVACSSCGQPTSSPVFMGVTDDGARLPLFWCPGCKARFEATS